MASTFLVLTTPPTETKNPLLRLKIDRYKSGKSSVNEKRKLTTPGMDSFCEKLSEGISKEGISREFISLMTSFQGGYKYNILARYGSAISASHDPIIGIPVR